MKSVLIIIVISICSFSVSSQSIKFDVNGKQMALLDSSTLHLGALDGSVYIGIDAGSNTIPAGNMSNTFVGHLAGRFNEQGYGNTLMGSLAGTRLFNGIENTCIGSNSGRFNVSGSSNTYIGNNSGYNNKNGFGNAFVGSDVGTFSTSSSNNVLIGRNTGYLADSIDGFVAIGAYAGYYNRGIGNVCIGNAAGISVGSNQLMIDNNGTSAPMIHGHFDLDFLKFNAHVRIQDGAISPGLLSGEGMEMYYSNLTNTGTITVFDYSNSIWGTLDLGLHVVTGGIPSPANYSFAMPNVSGFGSALAVDWDTYSDLRIKSNVKPVTNGLSLINQLNPVTYFQHDTDQKEDGFTLKETGKKSIGLLAQEVYEILPDLVNKPSDEQKELWSMNYEKIIPILIQAVQELSQEVNELKKNQRE